MSTTMIHQAELFGKPLVLQTEDLDFAVDERDWGAVKFLLDEFEHELAERRSALLYRVSVWKMAVRILKRSTTEKMILKEPTQRDFTYHKAILVYLRGTGLLLQGELARQEKTDTVQIGISYQDFTSMVEELEFQEREWYGTMKENFRDKVLAEVFPG